MDRIRKAKLQWRCRRGMLELDLILNRFFQHHADQLSKQDTETFECLLTCPDPDIYSWFMGTASPANKELFHLVEFIKLHHHI